MSSKWMVTMVLAGVALLAGAAAPLRAHADHRPDSQVVLLHVEQLDAATAQLLACISHSAATRTDARFAEILHDRTCRMSDRLASPHASWGRTLADYYAVRSMYRVLDRRIARDCHLHDDPHVASAWQVVVHQFEQLSWLIEPRRSW